MKQRIFRWLKTSLSKPYRELPYISRDDLLNSPEFKIDQFGSPESIDYTIPHHQSTLLPEYRTVIGDVSYAAPFVVTLPQARINGEHALVTTADGRIVGESVFNHRPYVQDVSAGRIHYPATLRQFARQALFTARFDTVFILANYFGNAYYHWMLEAMPRLWLYLQYREMLGESPPVLVSQPLPAYARQMLEWLGIDDVILWDATYGIAEHLLLPMAVNGTGIPSPALMEHVTHRMIESIGELPHIRAPRIYISRQLADRRRIVNEADVADVLAHHEFRSVTLENMSLREQIALFQQAEVVVGAHGAGFANCVYSTGIKMIEFFEPSYINVCFYRLACGYGFDYGYLVGESQGPHIIVDTDALEQMLRDMGIT